MSEEQEDSMSVRPVVCAAQATCCLTPGAPASPHVRYSVYIGVTETAERGAEGTKRRDDPNTLSTQESKNSRAACRAEPKEHSSMNWENICVCSSWEYSLWLERSRDLRKPDG